MSPLATPLGTWPFLEKMVTYASYEQATTQRCGSHPVNGWKLIRQTEKKTGEVEN